MASKKEKESVEISAKTVEEAIERGLSELGLTRDQVEVEVINPGRGGVLGFGAEDAQVRITALLVEPPPDVESLQAEAVAAESPQQAESVDTSTSQAALAIESVAVMPDFTELSVSLLQGLLDRMNIKAQVTARIGDDLVEEGEEPPLTLDITGDDLGILIGRRGETLRALQYMTRLMLSKSLKRWEPVVVDVEAYRVRRRRLLRQLAARMAERVAFSQQRVVLEAMPAHERRIVHIALRDHQAVTTKSIGEGEHRKVTIIPR
jgi:spoIIIJ-associated protein